MRKFLLPVFGLMVLLLPVTTHAVDLMEERLDLTHHFVGYMSLFVLALAYFLVVLEEQIHLHKSKPVLLAAGIIWVLIAIVYQRHGIDTAAEVALRHSFLEYSELFFFLLVAMSYINALINRDVFDALRYWLIVRGFGYRSLFWITGILAFCISPVADNLTTALIMCTVVMTVGVQQPKFMTISSVNIVVAANAGGAFSPFGDITTLMVWQKGIIEFSSFFQLFIPAVVNFVVPAICMHFSIPKGKPEIPDGKVVEIADGGLVIAGLFLLTILTAVCFHGFLHLPPAIGMLTGLGYLKFFSYYQSTIYRREQVVPGEVHNGKLQGEPIDVFKHIADAEWDTLFFSMA